VAVLGLYSLMAYVVAWRTREIGIRLALGATTGRITRLVVGGGVALTAAGIAIGLVLSVAGARWLEPHLFDTPALDPLVFATVPAVLLAVALLAGWVPARRALRIKPTEALRAE
jgi:ABC-type antimicrobial peptide transport system permease subunit